MSELPQLPKSPEFERAAAAVRDFVQMPSEKDALKFYGLYKFGCHGKNSEGPPLFPTFYAGKKWAAWNTIAESGITPDDAQKQYVAFYEANKEKYEAGHV